MLSTLHTHRNISHTTHTPCYTIHTPRYPFATPKSPTSNTKITNTSRKKMQPLPHWRHVSSNNNSSSSSSNNNNNNSSTSAQTYPTKIQHSQSSQRALQQKLDAGSPHPRMYTVVVGWVGPKVGDRLLLHKTHRHMMGVSCWLQWAAQLFPCNRYGVGVLCMEYIWGV